MISAEADINRPTFELSRPALFAVAYVCAFLSSKFLGLSVGYALDDYAVTHPGSEGLAGFFLSQGRYTNAALDLILQASQLNMTSFSVVAFVATLILSTMFYLEVFSPRSDTAPSMVVAIAALLGAHSYYTEYVTFRQSALPMSVMFGTLVVAARQYRIAVSGGSRPALRLTVAASAGIVAMGANQLALCYATIGVLYMHMAFAAQQPLAAASDQAKPMLVLKALAVTMAAGVALTAGNLVVAKIMRLISGVEANGRATLITMEQLPERAGQLLELMPSLLMKAEPIASTPAKVLLLLSLLFALIPLAKQRLHITAVAIIFAVTSWCIALLPHLVSATWWPVPRTLVAIPIVLAGTLALSSHMGRLQSRASATLALAASILFCAHSNSMLLDQQRINRWDIARAQEIAYRAAERFPDKHTKLAVVGGAWAYPVAPRAVQGDMNLSALSIAWAIDPLFDEATGTDLHVRAAPELFELCRERPVFPSSESLFETESEVVVCL